VSLYYYYAAVKVHVFFDTDTVYHIRLHMPEKTWVVVSLALITLQVNAIKYVNAHFTSALLYQRRSQLSTCSIWPWYEHVQFYTHAEAAARVLGGVRGRSALYSRIRRVHWQAHE
jgi:hypothetical protein